MASYRGLKQVGEGLLDYMMKHRPEVPEEDELLSQGLHDLEELFPGIYKDGQKRYRTSGDAVTSEAMDAINAVRGIPDAEVDVFRAVPQGVRDFNVGDWVTTSKSYAHKHGGHALNGDYDIITGKAKASDLYNPGDSIAEMGYWGLPMAGKVTRGLIPAVGAGGLLGLMGPEEAEAGPVYSKDGRRLLDLLDKAAKGELTPDEPPMEYPAKLPDGLLKSYQADDPRFVSESLGSSEGDIFHYWNDHNRHMTNEQIEDAMHAILYADERFHTKGNPPWTEGLGAVRDGKGYNASLYPGEQFTGIYQLNPINEKRLLKKMKSLEMGTPDESAGHPIVARPDGRDVRSERVSADGVRNEVTIPDSLKTSKAIIPLTVGGVLVPRTAEADGSRDSGFWPEMARQFGLGTRGVIEGLGTGATLGFGDPGKVISDWIGLPVPQTDIERKRVGLNAGVTDALTTFAGGAGAAKMAANPVIRGVGMELADKPLLGVGIGGLLGLLTYDEED